MDYSHGTLDTQTGGVHSNIRACGDLLGLIPGHRKYLAARTATHTTFSVTPSAFLTDRLVSHHGVSDFSDGPGGAFAWETERCGVLNNAIVHLVHLRQRAVDRSVARCW